MKRRHLKVWVSGLVLLFLVGIVLAGCGSSSTGTKQGGSSSKSTATSTQTSSGSGGSSSSSSSSSSGGSGTSKSSSGADLNIAVAAPFSGNSSFIGSRFLNGVKVAVNQINNNGGVLGHKLNIVTADTAGDPVDAVPSISQIISTKKPVAMIGPSSLTITSVDKQLEQDHLVDVTLGGTTQLDQMNFKYIFRTSPSDSQMGIAMAYYGIKKGYKKAALVFGSNESAQTLVGPVKDTLTKHGVSVVKNLQIAPDQSSYRSEIEKILSAKPDVLFVQFDPQTASTFFSEWRQLGGGQTPVIGSDVTASSDFIKAITPQYASQVLTSVQGSTSGGSAATEYATFYGQVFNGAQPVTLSNNAYDAVTIIALAMLEAKSTKPSDYVNYMVKVANGPGTKVYDFKTGAQTIQGGATVNYEGASGPDDFNQYHNVTGAFQAVKTDAKSKLNSVMDITPQDLLNY